MANFETKRRQNLPLGWSEPAPPLGHEHEFLQPGGTSTSRAGGWRGAASGGVLPTVAGTSFGLGVSQTAEDRFVPLSVGRRSV
jgi:hypothetical protein